MRIGLKVLLLVTLTSLLAVAVSIAVCILIHDIPLSATIPMVMASAGIIVIAVTVGFAVTRLITAPLSSLIGAAEQFAKGDFGHHIDASSSDELGTLGKAFNTMSDELKRAKKREENYKADLEREVSEKTVELQQKIDELEEFTRLSVGRELRMVEFKREIVELKKRPAAVKGKGRQRGPEASESRKAG